MCVFVFVWYREFVRDIYYAANTFAEYRRALAELREKRKSKRKTKASDDTAAVSDPSCASVLDVDDDAAELDISSILRPRLSLAQEQAINSGLDLDVCICFCK